MDLSAASQEDADSRDFQSGSEIEEGDSNMIATEIQTKNGITKPNPKDPNRPRRKKARRACFACQRAHLTCGMYLCLVPSLSERLNMTCQ